MGDHARPIAPFKLGPTIPVPSHIFDECVTCGKPIEGPAVISGGMMAWHEDCFLPVPPAD